jgi:long-chain acyl-CoA synthetase
LRLKDAEHRRSGHDGTVTAAPPPTRAAPLDDSRTLPAAFQRSVVRVPERVALRDIGGAIRLTWAEYGDAVERAAGALAGLGVRRGDRVALLSRNRPELAICEVAALHLGAATVVLYTRSPAATVEHVLADCEPRLLVAERRLAGALDGRELAGARMAALEEVMAPAAPPPGFSFEGAWRAVEPTDLLAVLYTSGTTGLPKGVEWEHGAMLRALRSFDSAQPPGGHLRDVSFAPFANVGERAGGHWRGLLHGATRTFCLAPDELPGALRDARPTFVWAPPRVWQGLDAALAATLGEDEREILTDAVERRRADVPPPSAEREAVLAALRARLGLDRVERALTAAAPCPPALQQRFHALGIPFGEFFAMTELAAATSTRPGPADLGTVGVALAGCELRLAADGELLVRGAGSARGYRNLAAETAAVFVGGWVHTGDLGSFDREGRLRLVGRRSEFFTLDDGHNLAPAPLESELKALCPVIGHVCVLGQGRPHAAALVVLEPPARAADPESAAAVAAAVSELNAGLDPRERIGAHAVLPEPWGVGEELTETMKLRRERIATRHADAIEALYGVSRR